MACSRGKGRSERLITTGGRKSLSGRSACSSPDDEDDDEDDAEDEEEELDPHVDGRRANRGRKARSTILVAEKLRWIERVEAQMAAVDDTEHAVWHTSRRTPGSGSGPAKYGRTAGAVRAALEEHDKPYVKGEERGGKEHYKWSRAITRWLKQAPVLRAQDRRKKLSQVRRSSAAEEKIKHTCITEQMLHSAPFESASKLHKLVRLSMAMEGDAAFARQVRRKYV